MTGRNLLLEAKGLDLKDGDVLLVLVGEKYPSSLDQIRIELASLKCDYVGGVFPEVMQNYETSDSSILLQKLSCASAPLIIKDLNNKIQLQNQVASVLQSAKIKRHSLITFVDGLSPFISHYVENLYSVFGPGATYIGGGAGRLTLKQEPCLFDKNGVYQDAALLIPITDRIATTALHGWKVAQSDLVATESDGNRIQEINWNPAASTYKNIVELQSKQKFNATNFFELSKCYPLGIQKFGAEHVIRDPVATDEREGIVCVGPVPCNSVLDLMTATPDDLIQAAKTAAETSIESAVGIVQGSLVIDCVSRKIFLGDMFKHELSAIQRTIGSNNFGALTLGEISSGSDNVLEFYNKTVVVGVLYE